MKISRMQQLAWEHAENMGFHDLHAHLPENDWVNVVGWRGIALIGHEVGELADGFRQGDNANVAEELADIVIRCGDLAEMLCVDLEGAILTKMEKNKTRGKLHGKHIIR